MAKKQSKPDGVYRAAYAHEIEVEGGVKLANIGDIVVFGEDSVNIYPPENFAEAGLDIDLEAIPYQDLPEAAE